MTTDEIIAAAREAGFWQEHINTWMCSGEAITSLAEIIAAREREECAKVCESLFDMEDDSCDEAEVCAAAIRARKTP